MKLQEFATLMRPSIEEVLKQAVNRAPDQRLAPFYGWLTYHMGWEEEGAGVQAQGKRIRPLMVLLCCLAADGEWQPALPAAAAVELVHNFSLIHDDVEDQGEMRHGRPTVWVKAGTAQAINAGDLLFTLAQNAVLGLKDTINAQVACEAAFVLNRACQRLTEGQYLDLSYEKMNDLPLDAYFPMVNGKTASLLSACAELGAVCAQVSPQRREAYTRFGNRLGMAFQAVDDWLGIWGDAALVGKSVESDLLSKKKTLPVLFGLQQKGKFADQWRRAVAINPDDVPHLAKLLVEEGAQDFTVREADRLTDEALSALKEACPRESDASLALLELANALLRRDK